MRMREVAAVAAGIAGAAGAHALDAAGLLPGVHEAADVREAMGPISTAGWLILAGVLAWLAVRTRPAPVGAGAALLVSAIPELVGRHDVGAIAEPGAIAGALVQWLLLLAVVAVALVVDRSPAVRAPSPCPELPWHVINVCVGYCIARVVDSRGRPRAPPVVLSAVTVL